MSKKPKLFADKANALPVPDDQDALDLILRRLDVFVADARLLATDIHKFIKDDKRELQLLQVAHRLVHDAAVGIDQAHLRNTMQI
jgi:hypothetical protein